MALHGVLRGGPELSAEALALKKASDSKKIENYRQLTAQILQLRTTLQKEKESEEKEREQNISPEGETEEERVKRIEERERIELERHQNMWSEIERGLSLCSEILRLTSEFYTIWNIRKELFLLLLTSKYEPSESNKENKIDKLRRELQFSEDSIKYHYKSYWAWYHRQWLIEQFLVFGYAVDWNREIYLCSKLLSLDSRNFHCWNYRRHIVSRRISIEKKGDEEVEKKIMTDEHSFTTYLLENKDSFSNYSAFHQRTLLFPRLNPDQPSLLSSLQSEIEMLHNAWFTQPNDSSPWFYFLWLMNYSGLDNNHETVEKEIELCNELLSVEPDCKWPMLMIVILSLKKVSKSQSNKEQVLTTIKDHLTKLERIDKKHQNYYQHLLKSSQQ